MTITPKSFEVNFPEFLVGTITLKLIDNGVFFYRLNFIPNKNEVRLSRRDSYTPDPQLEQEVQEILSHQEEEQQRLEKIVEEVNGHNNLLATSPTEYHLTDIKPRRSRQFRSSVYIKVKAGEEKTRERAAKKRADEA